MPVSESINLLAGTWFFFRGFIKAVITYSKDAETKWPQKDQIRGQGLHSKDKLPDQLPSIIDIKKALPRHCFQPKISTSMYYAIKDFVLVAITYMVFMQLLKVPYVPFQATATVVYWAVQGTFFIAVFVIGHDCGHGSFSNSDLLNNTIGQIWHGFIMTPYFMWKLSHWHHHKFTGNIDKDEVYYPLKESEPCAKQKTLPGFGFGLGWFGYLARGYNPRNVNHFNPFQKMFAGHVLGCVITLCIMTGWGYCLSLYAAYYGLWALFSHYIVPLFVFGCYIVVITFLHHNEMNIPWYADDQWHFVKGQLSTVDRHYGYVHNVIHNIGTHQIHHMFIKIPHYHLEEATEHFRRAFPHLVRLCHEPIMESFMRMLKKYDSQCVIADDTKVHYYE